jgi:16S rRNA (cytosine967-C5)-methyltransferase
MPASQSLSGSPGSFKISAARREAFAILLEVERGKGHSDDLLRGARVSALSLPDRQLCTALVMGTLRSQIRMDALIRPLLAKPNARLDPEVQIALRLGALQLLFLDRIPAHAAIGESVALAKAAGHTFAAGMVNAVLRRLARLPKPQTELESSLTSAALAQASAHPLWMVKRWVANYGFEAACRICRHGQEQPQTTLRLNSPELEAEMEADGIQLEPGALLAAARRVVSGDVAATQASRDGRVRHMDEGSQLIAELAGNGNRILDCCAAPGGKTLVLAERNPEAEITACEVNPGRLDALRRRIAEMQDAKLQARIQFVQADAAELAPEPAYDLVLADVPCSGTGTLGRNPEIRHRLRLEDLSRQAERQRAILSAALRALRPGGRVLYSTCSLEPEENAEVVDAVLGDLAGFRRVTLAGREGELHSQGRLTRAGAEALLGSIAADGSLTLLPGRTHDGFFAALLKRLN